LFDAQGVVYEKYVNIRPCVFPLFGLFNAQGVVYEKNVNIRPCVFTGGKVNVGPPKTAASSRTIPLLSEVREALVTQNTYCRIMQVRNGENVPGRKGYIFLNSKGNVYCPASINCAINTIVKSHNKENLYDPLPHFSVHQIRHTFCSRLCEMDVNVKVIQSVMGHSDYQTTMDIYTDITDEKKQADFAGIDEKMRIGMRMN